LRVKAQILGICAEDGTPTDAIACRHAHLALNQNMARDIAVIANANRALDDRKGTNANVVS
jgi:hypothetical protein